MRIRYIRFLESTGYGIAAAGLIRALRDAGAEVAVTSLLPGPTAQGGRIVGQDHDGAASAHGVDSMDDMDGVDGVDGVIVHTVPEYYPYWLRRMKREHPGAPVWGYTAWETDLLPPHWPGLLNRMDGIFVPSAWNREVFRSSGVRKPVRVVAHVSEFHGRPPEHPPSPALERWLESVEDRFLFYYVGAWSERKDTASLLQAFLDEFDVDERVALLLKTGELDWSSYRSRWNRALTGSPAFRSSADSVARILELCGKRHGNTIRNTGNLRIIHIPDPLPSSDLAWLHARSDCFLSLTRGEGWGMGGYEAAWFGNGVVMTGYGGQLDYLPPDAACLIPYTLVPVSAAYGRKSYRSEQKWAAADSSAARRTMRRLAAEPERCRALGSRLQRHVRAHFAPQRIAESCLEVFR